MAVSADLRIRLGLHFAGGVLDSVTGSTVGFCRFGKFCVPARCLGVLGVGEVILDVFAVVKENGAGAGVRIVFRERWMVAERCLKNILN